MTSQYPIPNDEQCRICQQATRKDEREKALDELEEWCHEYEPQTDRMITRSNRWWLRRIKEKIEELRKGGE